MKQSIRFTFGPSDPLNPEFGYEFEAESRHGVEMRTGTNPDTGEPLTIHDCIALAQTFAGPDPTPKTTYASEGDCPGCENCGPPIVVTADEGCG